MLCVALMVKFVSPFSNFNLSTSQANFNASSLLLNSLPISYTAKVIIIFNTTKFLSTFFEKNSSNTYMPDILFFLSFPFLAFFLGIYIFLFLYLLFPLLSLFSYTSMYLLKFLYRSKYIIYRYLFNFKGLNKIQNNNKTKFVIITNLESF